MHVKAQMPHATKDGAVSLIIAPTNVRVQQIITECQKVGPSVLGILEFVPQVRTSRNSCIESCGLLIKVLLNS